MSEIRGRRALKKAQTRRHIRHVAQRMFAAGGFEAVTIVDVAREADVAVQTVFNHFASKEELFCDGRLPRAEGPAEAVRRRAPGVSPLTALRQHLVEVTGYFVALQASPEGRTFSAALAASPALTAYEQRVIHEAEQQLGAALAEAWATDPEPGAPASPAPEFTAPLTAAIWMAAVRAVVVEQRRLAEREPPCADAAERLADSVLAEIQTQLGVAATLETTGRRTDTGWPLASMRRAG